MGMHKDATGRQIKKGDYIAYATANRSSSGLKFGAVIRLKSKDVEHNNYDYSVKPPQLITRVETIHSMSIISADKTSSYDPNTQTYTHKWVIQGKHDEERPARVQSIERLERVILLNPDQMEPDAKELLDRELHERGAI